MDIELGNRKYDFQLADVGRKVAVNGYFLRKDNIHNIKRICTICRNYMPIKQNCYIMGPVDGSRIVCVICHDKIFLMLKLGFGNVN